MSDINTDFGFVEVEETAATNEFDAVIAAQIERGPRTGYPLTAATDEVEKHLRRYARAANRAGKSPKRGAETVDAKAGTTTVIVTLRPQIVKGANKDETVEGADPVEDTDSAE